MKKYWGLVILKNSVFLSKPLWFFKKNNASFPWKQVKVYWLARMGPNFDQAKHDNTFWPRPNILHPNVLDKIIVVGSPIHMFCTLPLDNCKCYKRIWQIGPLKVATSGTKYDTFDGPDCTYSISASWSLSRCWPLQLWPFVLQIC